LLLSRMALWSDCGARRSRVRDADGDAEASLALAIAFASGAGGSLQMSYASFLGPGHRVGFYGDDGTLVLVNPTADSFRGSELMHGRRGDERLQTIAIANPHDDPSADSRIAPAMRLVRRFLDACERGSSPSPSLADGYRVQCLIDASRRAHASGR